MTNERYVNPNRGPGPQDPTIQSRLVVYDPQFRKKGVSYYSVADILRILHDRCDRDSVKTLCEEALTRQPRGLQLRNEYLLSIRVDLQAWREGVTLGSMAKVLVSELLDDSVEGGPYPYQRLSLRTVVGYDPSRILDVRLGL
ncbi:MAG: hypothetical protein QQN63_13410 [Nitrosopumilus sp.]